MQLALSEAQLLSLGYDSEGAKWAMGIVAMMEGEGLPLVDHAEGMPLDKPEHRLDQVFAALDALQPGITHFVIHPSHDTPEARAIDSDLPSRICDYEAFMDERVREHIRKTGVQVIGYRHLKALMH